MAIWVIFVTYILCKHMLKYNEPFGRNLRQLGSQVWDGSILMSIK
jgi:hypothetical protein